MQHDSEPAWAGDAGRKRARRQLWKIFKEATPGTIGGLMASGVGEGLFGADEALVFPLAGAMDKSLACMVHKHPDWPGLSRDDRLVAWFGAAVDAGAQPVRALRVLHARSGAAMVRLMGMKAHGSLAWWQDRGVEMALPEQACLGGAQANLATIAFIHGKLGYLEAALGRGDKLEHLEKLWPRLWSKPCLGVSDRLLALLVERAGDNPPMGAMSWWAGAWVNKNNVQSVLASGRRLVEMGANVNEVAPGCIPALGAAVNTTVSPSCSRIVEFLLEQGADPLAVYERVPGQAGSTTCAMDAALHRWIGSTPTSALRDTMRKNFLAMAGAVDPALLCEHYSIAKREAWLDRVRQGAGGQAAGQDGAELERLWLQAGAGPVGAAGGRALRF